MNAYLEAAIATGAVLAMAAVVVGWIAGALEVADRNDWPTWLWLTVTFVPLIALTYLTIAYAIQESS